MRVGRLIFGLKMVVRWSLTVDYNGRRQNVRKDVMFFLLPPATKLMQDGCDSVHRGCLLPGGSAPGGVPMGVPGPGGCLLPGAAWSQGGWSGGSAPGGCLVRGVWSQGGAW